jgi:hypothetical protein
VDNDGVLRGIYLARDIFVERSIFDPLRGKGKQMKNGP